MFLTQVDEGLIENITIEDVINKVLEYHTNIEDIVKIRKAYELANNLHSGVLRESGESYITHPLSVAYTCACLRMDISSICAAILHDVVEDTDITLEEIKKLFGTDVSMLVDGVTKLKGLNSVNKEEKKLANMKKIILSMKKDIRIILIKLADRLHNMRTLQYKKREEKRIENALETLDLFAPIANRLGIYRMKTELEDLGLKYANPSEFERVNELIRDEEKRSKLFIEEMLGKINDILTKEGYNFDVKVRTKNVYGVYKRLTRTAKSLDEIHDLIAFKILVDEIDYCYSLLRPIHATYKPVNANFKDYICSPKKNMYQSIHTTVHGLNKKLVQMQLRTFEMDKVASLGITANLSEHQDNAKVYLQEQAKNNFPFYKGLSDIATFFENDNKSFVDRTLKELFSDNVYVSDIDGEVTELPLGSTIIDYAYKKGEDFGNYLISAKVNDEEVDIEHYILKSNDRVELVLDFTKVQCVKNWAIIAKTTRARKLILENY